MGVCNPTGEAADYNGLYFTDADLRELARGQLRDVPVKAEHRGQELGRVVSSSVDGDGRLNCVMRIAEDTVEGAIAAGLVKDGIARELSLGYSVDVAHTGQKLQAGAKRVLEVSLVRKGAREACFVTAFEDDGQRNGAPSRPRSRRTLMPGSNSICSEEVYKNSQISTRIRMSQKLIRCQKCDADLTDVPAIVRQKNANGFYCPTMTCVPLLDWNRVFKTALSGWADVDAENKALKSTLYRKQREIDELEGDHQRHIAQLEDQLEQVRQDSRYIRVQRMKKTVAKVKSQLESAQEHLGGSQAQHTRLKREIRKMFAQQIKASASADTEAGCASKGKEPMH
jgi:hypothetical protein